MASVVMKAQSERSSMVAAAKPEAKKGDADRPAANKL